MLGRTEAGLHRIDSALAFVDVCDFVRAAPATGLSLSVSGPMARRLGDLGAGNDVLRAASELRRRAGIRAGAALRLEKHIPPGAGLGGGTADGAAALRALSRLWSLRGDEPAVQAARALGADGPACLQAQACWAGGTGAELEPMPAPSGHVVLVWPSAELSTARVYAHWQGPGRRPAPRRRGSVRDHVARTANDLEEPAARLAPVVRRVRRTLAGLRGVEAVRMTGSGSAVFAVVARRQDADAAVRRLRQRHPGWWVRAASFLPAGQTRGRVRYGGNRFGSRRRRARR